MGQMMSSCEQNEDGQETSISSETSAKDLRNKISDILNQHVNRSDRKVINSQSVLIEETPDAVQIHEHTMFQTKQCKRFLGIGPKKCCPIFGCNYEINQNIDVEINSLNETVINEIQNITNAIIQSAASSTESQAGSGAQVSGSDSSTTEDFVKEEVKRQIESLVNEDINDRQVTSIRYNAPIRCVGDPCDNQGPMVDQNTQLDVTSQNIINKTLEIIEDRSVENDAETTIIEEGKDNTECIISLLISGSFCLFCILILWMVVSSKSGGGEGGGEGTSQGFSMPSRRRRRG